MKILKKIVGVFCLFLAIGSIVNVGAQTQDRAVFIVMTIVFTVLAVLCLRSTKKEKEQKIEKAKKKYSEDFSVNCKHVNGLPIAENAMCKVTSKTDRYEIESSGATFTIDKKKVTDVCMKTDVDIQKQYVSSVGGAVAGAVLFGPLGAIIGGRAKEKKTKEIHNYLIFTYNSDGEVKYVGFDVTTMPFANKFVAEWRLGEHEKVKIDL